MSIKLMSKGPVYEDLKNNKTIIYAYIYIPKDRIAYIGKDKRGDKMSRHYDHLAPGNKDEQLVNKVLQRRPGDYKYVQLAIVDSEWVEDVEAAMIAAFKNADGQCWLNLENILE